VHDKRIRNVKVIVLGFTIALVHNSTTLARIICFSLHDALFYSKYLASITEVSRCMKRPWPLQITNSWLALGVCSQAASTLHGSTLASAAQHSIPMSSNINQKTLAVAMIMLSVEHFISISKGQILLCH
jgi:hypothetical protein